MNKGVKPNRLIKEKSPYLLQHAHNPVDWYPWGEEAFQKAIEENKLIFLSIGYSTCHWCHVMEKESFEDTNVAQLMNKTLVSIKVDREERPDIDSYYMSVCQMLIGSGGWPLTIIMSPDKMPFFAATYLPRETRFGRPGLLELIPQIDNIWQTRKEEIINSANRLSELLRNATQAKRSGELDKEILTTAFSQLIGIYDETAGGFGNTPKFPTTHNLSFLLRYHSSTGNGKALSMVEHTLRSMRMGGIYDHIGFGFHRYSTDAMWRVPHFEKMLYDQALSLVAYTEAFQITKNSAYRATAEEIIKYVVRNMTSDRGVFYSAEDADSEGEEGKYYVWTDNEIAEVLEPAEARIIRKTFNISQEGNYENESTRSRTGSNILYMTKSLEDLSSELGISLSELTTYLTKAKKKMFEHRNRRVCPLKDKKILCDWNGMMIAALSKAGRVLDNTEYIKAAERAADFILTKMRTPAGGVYHRFIDGEPAVPGFLDDYAFLVWGLTELYEATLEEKYLATALDMNEQTIKIFWDHDGGAFYFTPEKSDFPLRKKEIHDGAIPSGNGVAMLNLIRLARLTGRHDLEDMALRVSNYFADQIKMNPLSHVQTLIALGAAVWPSLEVVVSGDPGDPTTTEMLRVINTASLLDLNVILRYTVNSSVITTLAPFTENLLPTGDKTTVYICVSHECKMPITDTTMLTRQLTEFREKQAGG